MKQLNLDDFGLEAFTPERINPLMAWHRGKKLDPRKYRERFNLRRGYGEKEPYVWLERLADWRRMERIHSRCYTDYVKASDEYWAYLKVLWNLTKKQCGKRVEGYYLQTLKPGKKTSKYMDHIHMSGYEKTLSKGSRDRKEAKPTDASTAWIWLGTPEEEEANRLDRRADQLRARSSLAEVAFMEAVRIRLASWWREEAKKAGGNEYVYSRRKVFTAIENDGRSYGWISGMGGPGEMVWSPHEPPTFFK
jgi:hypothetical protein